MTARKATRRRRRAPARLAIGTAVALDRLRRVPWKVLEERFGCSTKQLRRDMRAAMSQKSRAMSHHGACVSAVAETIFAGTLVDLAIEDPMPDIFGSPSPPPPIQAPPPPTLSDPAVANAALQEQQRAARARGRGATILTGGMGVTSNPQTAPGYLLGSGLNSV